MNKYYLFFLIIPILCFGVIIYPKPTFKNELRYKYFSVSYDDNIDTLKLRVLLDSAEIRLNSKNVTFTGVQNIYIPNSKTKFMLISLTDLSSFGTNHDFNKIVINKTDVDSNLTKSYSEKYNRRTFTGVLEHELTHTYLREKLGWFSFRFSLPAWKNEGYCDYVANGGSFPTQRGIELIKKNQIDDSYSFKYFTYRVRVQYLLYVKKVSVDALFEDNYDEKILDKEAHLWLFEQNEL